jgi:hypothetical protein
MPLKLRKLTERSEGTTESKNAISKMIEGARTSKAIKGTRRSDGATETETRKETKEAEGVKQGGKISFAAISNRWEYIKVHFNSLYFFQFQFRKKFQIKNRN